MSRTAIYARYSSHNQDGGTSIEVQLEQCRAAAGANPIEYVERAVSGTTMSRPVFNRMMADAAAGMFDCLYIHKFDRFGRDAESHRYCKILEACGVRVVSVTEGEDPLVRGIQLVVAEDFSRKLSERCRLGKRKSFQNGVWQTGIVPFGYQRDGQRIGIEPHPAESDAVRFAYETYSGNRYSLRQVANLLMDQGFRPRKAPYWTGGTMKAMLTLPLYRGVRRHGELEVHDPSLQIVNDHLWNKVNRIAMSRKATKVVGKRTQAFTRLLYCGECGSVFSRTSSTYKGKQYPYKWGCEQRLNRGAHTCPNRTFITENSLVGRIVETFADVFDDAEAIIAEATVAAKEQMRSANRDTTSLQARLRSIDTDIDRLMHLLTSGQIPDADAVAALSQRIGDSKRERDKLVIAIGEMSRMATPMDRVEKEVRRLFEQARKSLLNLADGAALNATFRETIGPMAVSVDGKVASAGECDINTRGSDIPQQAGAIIGRMFWMKWAA